MKMLKWTGIPAVLLAALLLIVVGCTERESPLGGVSDQAGSPITSTFSFDELKLNDMSDPPSRTITMAYASDLDPTIPQQPFPVLYMLHDYEGDSEYFERYNLQALLSDMYKKGEIGRMLVVTVDASNALGGSYFRNSGTLGDYEDVLSSAIAFVERSARVYTQGGSQSRAISGHGMGGYGAFRYAIDRPEMFGSVSSMSGPLSMGEPDGNFGVWAELLPAVFAENGVVVGQSDTYDRITAGRLNPMTNLYLAMTSAFSPHPLRRFDSLGIKIINKPFTVPGTAKDTFYNVPFFSALEPGPQTLKIADIGTTLGIGLDLLFDSVGMRADAVWARWKDTADVKTVFAARRAADPSFFDNVEMYFDVGADDEFGYRTQNDDFDSFLRDAGITHHTYTVYEGYGGFPAGHSQLIGSRLRDIIMFHDKLMARPPSPTN
jgi:S-formylglutathione hydrolase FrmB